jgi:hypothetical protein
MHSTLCFGTDQIIILYFIMLRGYGPLDAQGKFWVRKSRRPLNHSSCPNFGAFRQVQKSRFASPSFKGGLRSMERGHPDPKRPSCVLLEDCCCNGMAIWSPLSLVSRPVMLQRLVASISTNPCECSSSCRNHYPQGSTQ